MKQADSLSDVPVITIDGPSGAGKGTVCRLIAEQLGFALLDSGALYRLTALSCHLKGIDWNDEGLVAKCVENLEIRFLPHEGATQVFLGTRDVTQAIREEEIGMGASKVAAMASVREALLERQKQFRVLPGLVADGRDMGTVIFPDAQLKVFLTATAEERAQRRVKQLGLSSDDSQLSIILADIQRRDEQDRSRKHAPLLPAEDALYIDCTEMSIDTVVSKILSAWR